MIALHQCLSISLLFLLCFQYKHFSYRLPLSWQFLLETPDLCNLCTFVAIFFVAFYALFPPIFGGKKQTPPILECMGTPGRRREKPSATCSHEHLSSCRRGCLHSCWTGYLVIQHLPLGAWSTGVVIWLQRNNFWYSICTRCAVLSITKYLLD